MLNTSLAQLLCTPAYIFCVYSIFILSALGEVTFAVPLVFTVLNIFTDLRNRLFSPLLMFKTTATHPVYRTGQAAIDKEYSNLLSRIRLDTSRQQVSYSTQYTS